MFVKLYLFVFNDVYKTGVVLRIFTSISILYFSALKLPSSSVFIARQHTAADARYWYSNSVRPSVRLSVCLSIRDTLVLYENGLMYRHSFSTVR